MLCPRCSLPNHKSALACARCGQETPRTVGQVFHSRPAIEGPRAGARVAAEVQLGRGGVRAMDLPAGRSGVKPRVAAPHWERGSSRRSALLVPTDSGQALPSIVHEARTDPLWIEQPEPEMPETFPAISEPALVLASVWLRAAGWLADVGVVMAAGMLALLAGATAYGWRSLLPRLNRGLDDVLDGLVFGRGLWVFGLALIVLLAFAYGTLAHALAGMTLGQRLVGVRLETKDGSAASFSQSAWRAGIAIVTLALGGLSAVWAIFDAQGLALHDRLVGTRVVRLEREPALDLGLNDDADATEAVPAES
jgi:uncharacterized RDD family membrane protein YckC